MSLCLSVKGIKIILVAMMIAGWSSFAYCESGTAIFKSPLVWRTDGKGDYGLSQLQQGVYEVKETFLTAGQIKSIVVSYKSKGRVSLAVSVNGGIDYMDVVNGVPLDLEGQGSGVKGQGRRLKWKASIGANSQLEEVSIVYTDTSGVAGSFGNPELAGFKYRKKINITAKDNINTSLFNQVVKMVISTGDSLAQGAADVSYQGGVAIGFRDIRFTASDGQTSLPYYVGKITGDDSEQLAEVFIKVLQIPSSGVDIYLYYGNKLASDDSSIYEVFDINPWDYPDETILDGKVKEVATTLYSFEITMDQEEIVRLGKFSSTTLKENGNLVLADGADKGSFTSAVINTDFDIRIIKAVYTVLYPESGELRLDISADGGSTYRANCVSSRNYYATRGDFFIGSEIDYRFTFSNGRSAENLIEVDSIKLEYASGEISLISPNGREILVVGEKEEIIWTADEYGAYNIKLEYSFDNGKTYNLISKKVPNTGSFIWDVPQEFSDAALIKISDPFDFSVFDVSDQVFRINSKEEAARGVVLEEEIISAREEMIDLSAVIDDMVIRSDKKSYDVLVKVRDKMKDPTVFLDGAEITYKKGKVIAINPTGYEWGSSEKRNFLIIQVYLTDDEFDQIKPRSINTGKVDVAGALIFKEQKNIINLERLKFKGKKMGQVRKSLKNSILSKEIIEQVIE
ncbi:MAG: DUF2341 domain-containing protein [Candidatus Omnitrophota bacterium]